MPAGHRYRGSRVAGARISWMTPGAGGYRLLHGRGPHAARTGDLLRAVFHLSRETTVPGFRLQSLRLKAAAHQAEKRKAIANIQQSFSDSLAIANPMDGVFGTDTLAAANFHHLLLAGFSGLLADFSGAPTIWMAILCRGVIMIVVLIVARNDYFSVDCRGASIIRLFLMLRMKASDRALRFLSRAVRHR
jgi:hypothetical protein